MAKPVIKFKTYRQAAAVGGKIYGVPNLGDPVVAEVTMQEVIDYAKLHNYSADTLSALLSQVIAGVGDLVARDGRPRMLSDLLKFEPVIKGTFDNMEQTVTNQKVLVRPRMLKEIKVALDPSQYSWQNQNDKDSPKIISVAPASDVFAEVSLESFAAAIGENPFGWTYAGTRLCPNGWDANCAFAVSLKLKTPLTQQGLTIDTLYFHHNSDAGGNGSGLFTHVAADKATDNTLALSALSLTENQTVAWFLPDPTSPTPFESDYDPQAGDVLTFSFTRATASGDTFTVEKSYTL